MSLKVKWMSSFPDRWKTVPSKRLFPESKDRAQESDEQLSATQEYGVIPQAEFMRLAGRRVVQLNQHQHLRKRVEVGDFVISMRSFQGGLERAWASGGIRSSYVVLGPQKDLALSYYQYLFKSTDYIQALQSTANFIRDGQDMNYQNFVLINLPLPSTSEQRTIAAFLDYETARIDALISKQQRLIELLKEKRQAVISHAVTKGLNPDAPMKDSGVEWLGAVPEHWGVCLIKHKCIEITDGAHISPVTEGGKEYFVSIKDIKDGVINFSEALLTSPESYAYLVKAGCTPFPGDILFSKDGTIGQTAITPKGVAFVVASSLIIIRPNRNVVLPQYFDYLLQSGLVKEQVESFVKGAALRRLSIQNLLKVFGTFPAMAEQQAICDYLNSTLSTFSNLEALASRAIELMQERRTALISAAVTGKIDLRGWQQPAQESAA